MPLFSESLRRGLLRETEAVLESTGAYGGGGGTFVHRTSERNCPKSDLSNAPAVNLAGIRTTKWAEKSLLSEVRRATLQTSPRLFGQFL